MRNGASGVIPRQRSKDLVVRVHGDETLVLDRRTGTVHCLPAEVARVWAACTGGSSLAEIASAAGTDEHRAAAAVDQLLQLDLLDGPACCNRRKFLRRSAMAGAGAAAVPAIESVLASPALAAVSPQISIRSFTCSSTNGIVKGPLSLNLSGFTLGTYTVATTIGPAPSPSLIPGATYSPTPITTTLPNVSLNVLPSNPPSTLRGLVPDVNPTPVTIVVTDPAGVVVKTFIGSIGPCPCSTTYCSTPDTVDFTVSPSCTGTGTATVNLTYTLTGGLPGATYYFQAVSWSTPTVTYSNTRTADANGNFTFTNTYGAAARFSVEDTITVTLRQGSSSGTILRTFPVPIGPCPAPTPNLNFTVTPGCSSGGTGNQATLTYTLTNGVPGLTYYYTYAATTATGVNYSNTYNNTADANGAFTRAATTVGNSNSFNTPGTATVTLMQSSASGLVVATVPVTLGPCPPPPSDSGGPSPSGSPPAPTGSPAA